MKMRIFEGIESLEDEKLAIQPTEAVHQPTEAVYQLTEQQRRHICKKFFGYEEETAEEAEERKQRFLKRLNLI